MFKTILGVLVGLILGSSGMAVATDAFSPPPTPGWMNRPCATSARYVSTNCYWNEEQMGTGGLPNHFTRNFKVWVEDGTLDGREATLRCYFYTRPTKTGDSVDHCVSRNPNVYTRVSPQWVSRR